MPLLHLKGFKGPLAALLCPDDSSAELIPGDTLWPRLGKQRLLWSVQLGNEGTEEPPLVLLVFLSRNCGREQTAWQTVLAISAASQP